MECFFQAVAQSLSDRGTPPGDVILASNTVSIPLGRLTAGLARTHREWAPRLLGVRFLRPTFTVDDVEMTMSPPLPPPAGAPPATPREALRKEETAREEAARGPRACSQHEGGGGAPSQRTFVNCSCAWSLFLRTSLREAAMPELKARRAERPETCSA